MCELARARQLGDVCRGGSQRDTWELGPPFGAACAPDNPKIILLRTFAGGTEPYILVLAFEPFWSGLTAPSVLVYLSPVSLPASSLMPWIQKDPQSLNATFSRLRQCFSGISL